MAKKKEKKNDDNKKFQYQTEVNGILLVLISVIGIGRFGPVGLLISNFGVFLVGTAYNIFLGLLLFIGGYLILKREKPEYFSPRLIGFYIIFISFLVLTHIDYVSSNDLKGVEIFKETIDNFMVSTKNVESIEGGGIFGAFFSWSFVSLFEIEGTKIVILTLTILGIIIMFNVSLIDTIKMLMGKIKNIFSKKPKTEKAEDIEEDINPKVVISSIDELQSVNKEVQVNDMSTNEKIDSKYKLPPISILDNVKKNNNNSNQAAVKSNIEILERVLNDFDITGKVVEVHMGPSVTQYEMEIKAGTKVSKVLGIHKEIALALAAKDVRIQAPIPGKGTIGIEIPNKTNSIVGLKEILNLIPGQLDKSLLTVGLGKNIMGRGIYADISTTPHLLVAGATGSGKSVCINTIINSILIRCRPDEVKLVLVDPKKVELSVYNGIPHLMAPVVTDPKKAAIALRNIVSEMERRYDVFSSNGSKNIAAYNKYVQKHNETSSEKLKPLPYIVVIIDELADLMLVAAKEVEDSIMRITQMARAAGIHLIVATQRPSTDVITGLIKANIPSRISFAVSSSIDSRTILDMMGAEKLLGKGDMLFLPMGENVPIRIQGAFISEEEIKRIVDWTVKEQKAEYDDNLTRPAETEKTKYKEDIEEYDDPLYNEIVEYAITAGKISASLLQRKYRLGYNRAARIIDLLEERGIVGPPNGSKPREVLVKLEEK